MPNNLVFLGIEFLLTKRKSIISLNFRAMINLSFPSVHQQFPRHVRSWSSQHEKLTNLDTPRLNARQSVRDRDTSPGNSLSITKIMNIRTTTTSHVATSSGPFDTDDNKDFSFIRMPCISRHSASTLNVITTRLRIWKKQSGPLTQVEMYVCETAASRTLLTLSVS
jgi:hypothetical protein